METKRDIDSFNDYFWRGICAEREGNLPASAAVFQEGLEKARRDKDRHYENVFLNELEIRGRAIELRSKPRALHVMLTSRCNLRCPFCYVDHKAADLPDCVCRDIVSLYPYLQQITWQGGESFLHPAFYDLMRLSAQYPYLKHTILTNGTLIDGRWMTVLNVLNRVKLVISLESADPAQYSYFRRGAKLSQLTALLDRVLNEKKNGKGDIELSLNIIVVKSNMAHMDAIGDFVVRYGFNDVIFTQLYGCDEKFYREEYIDPRSLTGGSANPLMSIKEKLANNKVRYEDRFTVAAAGVPIENRNNAGKPRAATPVEMLCRAPWQQLYIHGNGLVKNYCHCLDDNAAGNALYDSLEELWNNGSMRALRSGLLAGDLKQCNKLCVTGVIDRSNFRIT